MAKPAPGHEYELVAKAELGVGTDSTRWEFDTSLEVEVRQPIALMTSAGLSSSSWPPFTMKDVWSYPCITV